MKQGILPVVLTAFILAHKANIALYKDEIFVPRITDVDVDEYLQSPKRFSLRWVTIDKEKDAILKGIASLLVELKEEASSTDPLEAARGLVAMIFALPDWTRRSQRLSDDARAVRDVLLKASDPHKVLFVDLASKLGASDSKSYIRALRAPLQELKGAYSKTLSSIEETMLKSLDCKREDLGHLNERAKAVARASGDLRLDAFATRLANFDGSEKSLEGILSLATDKPPREWVDRHIESATLELAKLARRFREAEAFVSVQGRKAHSEAIAVIIGTGTETKTITRSFSVSSRHRETIDSKATEIVSLLEKQKLGDNEMLAILAKAGLKLVSRRKGEDRHG